MFNLDDHLAASKRTIADMEHHTDDMRHAVQFRPSFVSEEDVLLAERLLEGWRSYQTSLSSHPEFRDREKHLALMKATGR